jgi:Predicted periplasmic or secreted lipoprotein
MPKKIRELIKELTKAGFIDRGGKGSHRNFKHPSGAGFTLSGNPAQDAKPYQEKGVREVIDEVKK